MGDVSLSKGTYAIELTRTATTATWSYVNLLNLVLTPKTPTALPCSTSLAAAKVYILDNVLSVEGMEPGSSIAIYSLLGEKLDSRVVGNGVEQFDLHNNAVLILQLSEADGSAKEVQKIVRH